MEQEISLRELIEILLRGRGVIAAITILAILVSGIFSFFILTPTYEARTTLMVSPMAAKSSSPDHNSAYDTLLSYLSQYPQMSLETYRVQVTNPHILNQVRRELDLGEDYSLAKLRSNIEVEAIKDTNLLRIVIKDSDPEMAAKIANTLAPKFVDYLTGVINEQMGKSAEFLQAQMAVEQENLEQISEELKDFMAKPQGVHELQGDIETKLALISDLKTQLVELDVEEKAQGAALAKVRENLKKEPKFFDLERSIIDDPVIGGLLDDENLDLGLLVKSQEINSSYTLLRDLEVELEVNMSDASQRKAALDEGIRKTQEELQELQGVLAKKETEYDRLMQEYTLAQETYNTFMKKYQEARVATSGKIGESNIMVVSPAIEDNRPVAPKKSLNVAIAAILGLMVGVFLVFFMDYWKNSSDEVKIYETKKGIKW